MKCWICQKEKEDIQEIEAMGSEHHVCSDCLWRVLDEHGKPKYETKPKWENIYE